MNFLPEILMAAGVVAFLVWLFWPQRKPKLEQLPRDWKPKGERDGR